MATVWNWISIVSGLALMFLYPILILVALNSVYRWNIERQFRQRVRNILETFHSNASDEVLVHIDVVYRQCRDLQKWHPALIGLLEQTFKYISRPSTLIKSRSWSEEELKQYIEIVNVERNSYRYPKLNREIQGDFNVIRSLLEGCGPAGWEEALMNFARNTQKVDQREEKRQMWNRVSVLLSFITSVLTIFYLIHGLLN